MSLEIPITVSIRVTGCGDLYLLVELSIHVYAEPDDGFVRPKLVAY
jgi:hypothetical protein